MNILYSCGILLFMMGFTVVSSHRYILEHIRLLFLATILLCFSVLSLGAQAEAAASPDSLTARSSEVRVLLFEPWNLDGTGGSEDQEIPLIIAEVFMNQLNITPYSIEAAESWQTYIDQWQRDDVLEQLPGDVTRSTGADVYVAPYYRFDNNRLFLLVRVYDARNNKIIAGDVLVTRPSLQLVPAVGDFLEPLVAEIQGELESILFAKDNPGRLTGTMAAQVRFLSNFEGAEVSIPGLGNIGTISDGAVSTPYRTFAVGQELQAIVSLEGFYEVEVGFTILGPLTVVQLPDLYPTTQYATEFQYSLLYPEGAGMALRYYLKPDWFYLRLLSHVGINVPDEDLPPGADYLVHRHLGLEAGAYVLTPPQSRYRLSYSAGFGMIFTALGDDSTSIDSYVNFGGITHEWNFERMTLFVRQELLYALPIFENRFFDTGIDIGYTMVPSVFGVMWKW